MIPRTAPALGLVTVEVPADEVGRLWPVAGPWLAEAFTRHFGEYGLDDVRAELDSGNWRLLVALDGSRPVAAAVLGIGVYPLKRLLLLQAAGGELNAVAAGGVDRPAGGLFGNKVPRSARLAEAGRPGAAPRLAARKRGGERAAGGLSRLARR